ncbi:MAG: hypothetical protein ABIN08_10025 [Caldimonas sp.]
MGAQPAWLLIEKPTKLELVRNMKRVKALGLNPAVVAAERDEVIE